MFATAIVAIDARLPARYTASLCKRVKWFSHWANSSTETDDGKGCDKQIKQCETHGNSEYWIDLG